MKYTIFAHGQVVTMNDSRDILPDGAVVIADDRIVSIGNTTSILSTYCEEAEIIDCTGKAIFPGLINTHIHSFQNMLKGLGTDKDLFQWLTDVIGPGMLAMTAEDLSSGAMLAGLDAIHSGTTTLVDYQYNNLVPYAADSIIDTYKTLGLRQVYARGYADTGAEQGFATYEELESIDTILEDCERLQQKYGNTPSEMFHLWLAPSAIWLCTGECLAKTGAFCKKYDLGMTAHMSETPFDTEASMTIHGKPELAICRELDLLSPKFLMVHCVTFTDADMDIAKETGATVAYNPISNMYLASGAAPVVAMQKKGLVLSVSTDGAGSNNSNDMLENMKSGVLLQKVIHRSPTAFTAQDILTMATVGGAKALCLDKEIGSLEPGKKADLFVFNPKLAAKSMPMHDPVAALVYASCPSNIETVMVDGKLVLDRERIPTIKEEEVLENIRITADALRQRLQQ